jgi:hypothetical protein
MSTQVQYRRGTEAQNNAFTGALAEITVDTTNGTLRVHDALTVGGSNIATVAFVNNAIGALSANAIVNGNSTIDIGGSGANITVDVNGVSNVAVFTSTGITVPAITKSGSNGVGNIGSTGTRFNQVFALASSAQYADLAEKYAADATYTPGTVVAFGGSQEITLCVNDACSRVAGVVSTNPSYRMNDGLVSEHTAMVALTGRVPTSVTGTVCKGDMIVSAGNGVARAEANPVIGTVIGKALENSEGDAVIEVVVGRV